MKWTERLRAPTGVDPVRAAGVFGALAGAASLLEPYWTGLAEALAAVAAVGWAMRLAPGGPWNLRSIAPAGVAGAAGAFALLAAPPWSGVRGALLGAAAAVLAWTARGARNFGEEGP